MIAAAQHDSDLAKVFRNRFILQSRQRGRELLERAAAEGEIAPQVDFEIALDMIYAPLYFRLLIGAPSASPFRPIDCASAAAW